MPRLAVAERPAALGQASAVSRLSPEPQVSQGGPDPGGAGPPRAAGRHQASIRAPASTARAFECQCPPL